MVDIVGDPEEFAQAFEDFLAEEFREAVDDWVFERSKEIHDIAEYLIAEHVVRGGRKPLAGLGVESSEKTLAHPHRCYELFQNFASVVDEQLQWFCRFHNLHEEDLSELMDRLAKGGLKGAPTEADADADLKNVLRSMTAAGRFKDFMNFVLDVARANVEHLSTVPPEEMEDTPSRFSQKTEEKEKPDSP